jgi:hypothetical protein
VKQIVEKKKKKEGIYALPRIRAVYASVLTTFSQTRAKGKMKMDTNMLIDECKDLFSHYVKQIGRPKNI